jgi:hypothetical protein
MKRVVAMKTFTSVEEVYGYTMRKAPQQIRATG